MSTKTTAARLPRHVAIIMDGNGRWAKKRGLPRLFGHRAAVKTVRTITEACSELGIEALTLYAFSTENWLRPKGEVKGLMTILRTYIKRELPTMMKNDIRFRIIGDPAKLPDGTRRELDAAATATAGNKGMVMTLALNYGGRQEIVRAVNRLLEKGARSVDEEGISSQLYTAGLPEPDLLIRTSGELRLSNFLLWQLAYAEFYFTPVFWPDFGLKDLQAAITEFQRRDRRYGGIAAH